METTSFAAIVLRHFDFLRRTYGFRVTENQGQWVGFASPGCRVLVIFDRQDLFVDLSSGEPEPIQRVRVSLGALLELKGVPPTPEPATTMEAWVGQAARLLQEHGHEVLSGDWTIRARIVQEQTSRWLGKHYGEVMSAADPVTREARRRQFLFEFRGQDREHREQTWRSLDAWMQGPDEGKRRFAEWVVAAP